MLAQTHSLYPLTPGTIEHEGMTIDDDADRVQARFGRLDQFEMIFSIVMP